MGFDLKYLVVSITAIFISLGIGIFIGSNMNSDGFITDQQQILINSIEDKLTEYNNEHKNLIQINETLKQEIEKKDYYINTFYGKITHGRLNNINVVVIQFDDFETNYINEAVYDAGGDIVASIKVDSKLLNLSEQELREVNRLFHYSLSYERILDKLSFELIDYILKGRKTALIKYALKNQYIYSSFIEDNSVTPVDQIIITGGELSPNIEVSKSFISNMLESCKSNYIKVVGVETSNVEQSLIPWFIDNNISSVDNIDSLLGRLSLVMVLSGIEGNYGETDYANDLLPLGIY
ncbi:copper transporter [Serpentinicella alkaliphila]|uniref:Copper transport outer membrane protein MctB n=1 Tax=Serpentinicella alkaliphila TaxID=1734049 RepID=A0A4R2TJI0_9FIRM|nr:copper transporter [Serpentinicella alkaliphila]QUH26598.1 copper transporter [Serpentinicella alkaliphila]TCQ02936.1 copper transport outer membrane protein MctB [Serpentinicella alkaliphila]